jgi:hypothetical protein
VFLYWAITEMLVTLVEEGTLKTTDLTTTEEVASARSLVNEQLDDYKTRPLVKKDGITLEAVKGFFLKRPQQIPVPTPLPLRNLILRINSRSPK